jgi:hypothetical protein
VFALLENLQKQRDWKKAQSVNEANETESSEDETVTNTESTEIEDSEEEIVTPESESDNSDNNHDKEKGAETEVTPSEECVFLDNA